MKRKTTKEILAESFLELAGSKSIERITIRDICENCGYSPATFYRQFKDKYDLIVWEYAENLRNLLRDACSGANGWRRCILGFLEYCRGKRTYLANLFLHTSGRDSFLRNMTELHCRCLSEIVTSCQKGTSPDVKTQMYIRIYCMGTVRMTCDWILGNVRATPEELAEIFVHSAPAPLVPLLCPG